MCPPWGVPNNNNNNNDHDHDNHNTSPTWAVFVKVNVVDVQFIGSIWRVFKECIGDIYI
jgi:hypothetical protein